ncbi:hypothetical protein ACJ73_05540 [Blastomyces percursus]|uniref:Uncharacterized protein n=1 Tax=Blastomyces percursus TaxID=1658174 RepID=A0A1J9R524_9EURO|nr:hypothetical protein ACJ73_05540 [Blastomyces percursus]
MTPPPKPWIDPRVWLGNKAHLFHWKGGIFIFSKEKLDLHGIASPGDPSVEEELRGIGSVCEGIHDVQSAFQKLRVLDPFISTIAS